MGIQESLTDFVFVFSILLQIDVYMLCNGILKKKKLHLIWIIRVRFSYGCLYENYIGKSKTLMNYSYKTSANNTGGIKYYMPPLSITQMISSYQIAKQFKIGERNSNLSISLFDDFIITEAIYLLLLLEVLAELDLQVYLPL